MCSEQTISAINPILTWNFGAPIVDFEQMSQATITGTTLPFDWLEIRTDDLAERPGWLVGNVVGEMGAVPNNDILVVDGFAVHEPIQVCLARGGSGHTVVDFGAIIPQDPDIAAREWPIRHCSC